MTAIENLIIYFLRILIIIAFYLGVIKALKILINYAKRYRENKLFNSSEYLPTEEIQTLKQVFFLIVITMSFTIIIYTLISLSAHLFSNYFVFVDIIISIIACLIIKKDTYFEKMIFLCLVPFASTTFALLDDFMLMPGGGTLVDPMMYPITMVLILFHLIGFAYIMKVYIGKFNHYTESNGLGISILLLFGIIFISFLITPITESVDLLDALVMVSNAFTSNGYAVLGTTTIGKLNSLFLVWGGYILSGVGTATLATALISRHFNKKFEKMEEKFDQMQKSIDSLKDERK